MAGDPAAAGDQEKAAQERAYRDVFEAVTSGENRKAARLLSGLGAAQLDELAVICGDVQVMAEAERRGRAGQAAQE